MASLKEVKSRINSVQSTRKITSAMKMVASAKLHKAQGAIANMLPYQEKLNKILTNFLRSDLPFESPFTVERPVARVAIVVFSSNGSLCGAFNANVLKALWQTVDRHREVGKENILIFPVGRKVEEAVKKAGYPVQGSFQKLSDKPSYNQAVELGERLLKMYLAHEIDRVVLIYHHFKSMGSQTLMQERFLPVDLSASVQDNPAEKQLAYDYIVEPSASELLTELLPKVLCQKIFTAALDSNASEHAARMLAMQIATDNASELIQDLTKQYNKTRQQAITNELLDIVGGSMK